MQHCITKSLCLFVLILTAFSSCKKDYSPDEPLPEEFSPTVFIGSQNEFLYALDPQTGDKKWELKINANIAASPLVLGENLYVGSETGTMYKIDAKRGTVLKTFHFGSGSLYSTPVGDGDFIYFGVGSSMIAIDVNADTLEWIFPTGGPVKASPVLFDTLCIFGSADGKVYAVDRIDKAQEVWTFNAGGSEEFYTNPTIEDSLIFIGSSNSGGSGGAMFAISRLTGTLQWKFPVGGAILSSPVAYHGNVIFGCNDYKLYCLDIPSGFPRWTPMSTKDRIVSSPFVHNQVIYVGSYDYKMYAVHIIDGNLLWEYQTDAIIKSSPMVYDNKLYFGSHDKYLYCLNVNNGDKIWKQLINGLIECSPAVDNLDGRSNHTSSVSGNSVY